MACLASAGSVNLAVCAHFAVASINAVVCCFCCVVQILALLDRALDEALAHRDHHRHLLRALLLELLELRFDLGEHLVFGARRGQLGHLLGELAADPRR